MFVFQYYVDTHAFLTPFHKFTVLGSHAAHPTSFPVATLVAKQILWLQFVFFFVHISPKGHGGRGRGAQPGTTDRPLSYAVVRLVARGGRCTRNEGHAHRMVERVFETQRVDDRSHGGPLDIAPYERRFGHADARSQLNARCAKCLLRRRRGELALSVFAAFCWLEEDRADIANAHQCKDH